MVPKKVFTLGQNDPKFLERFYMACFGFLEYEKIKEIFFSPVNARICKNHVEMFLRAGKTLEQARL